MIPLGLFYFFLLPSERWSSRKLQLQFYVFSHSSSFFLSFSHRRCSRLSASSRSLSLRTTMWSIHPLCTGSRSQVEPGSSASQRRDKLWRATGSRRQSPHRTSYPGPLKVWGRKIPSFEYRVCPFYGPPFIGLGSTLFWLLKVLMSVVVMLR